VLWRDDRPPRVREAVSTQMRAGSALDASNVRQEENLHPSLPPGRPAEYPEQIQRLLGWSSWSRSPGWIEIDGILSDANTLLAGLDLRPRTPEPIGEYRPGAAPAR